MSKKLELSIRNSSYLFSNADTKASVQEKLGTPDDIGGFFGNRKEALIFKYGSVEFHFSPKGRLVLIYSENEEGMPIICEKLQ
ncbi:hypothetical protein [Gynuella sunshinyii]|uniref:hypothetical protein n=1 Tax=Gynuella sunshinyii TaxID=1445505 RepID=UPI0005CBDCB6|nr:hypothetical protein [Gynuella sunshinyii]